MRLKTKVALGVAFLFALIIMVGGLGIYYLNDLSRDSQHVLAANYESLEYTKQIIESCDSLKSAPVAAIRAIDSNLAKQERNITEPGERERTQELRLAFEKLKDNGVTEEGILRIRQACLSIQDINMRVIIRNNESQQETSGTASTYLIIISTICALVAFTFIVNFPGYVANPIAQLTSSIKSIANKQYEERLRFDRKDEFGELAEAFNQMAEKLDEYEHSNLAKIIFEKQRIETIINRMSDPVIGLDESNRVIFANERALEILNLQATAVLGRYAPDVAVNNDLFRNLIRSGVEKEPVSIKAVVRGRENYFSRESIEVSYVPTGEKNKVTVGTVILLKNVTAYKELDLAKTNFIATISHELKTPIASLQMCVKLLRDNRVGVLNPEQQNVVQTLQDELARLSKITNELLDLSQVEAGNIKLDIRRTEPGNIVSRATEAVKFLAERKHVTIEYQERHNGSRINADIEKTTWVLVNLLTNAIRYSPENESILVASEKQNGRVRFSVRDKGPGIERKYVDRIFEKFFQIPGRPGGTGLGLSISKEFIEAQGGTISVESEEGKGSRFSFELVSDD